MKISVIIPTYNEEGTIRKLLRRFRSENRHEIIVVDGYSEDRTAEIARRCPVTFLETAKGRARQLNQGARTAGGDILVFLHADCVPAEGALTAIEKAVEAGYAGGCLSQRIESPRRIYRLIELSGNLRARIFRVFYGDQAIFLRRDIFDRIGGYDSVPILDDVIFSGKLKKAGKTVVLRNRVLTSARRWEKQGVAKTTLINWIVSLAFFCGFSPERLKGVYRDVR